MLNLEKEIVDLVKDEGQISIKRICDFYYEIKYIPKSETKRAIKSLIKSGTLVMVEDPDRFGNRTDEVVLSGLGS